MTEPTDGPQDEPLEVDASIADDLTKLWAALGAMAEDLGATGRAVAPACNGLTWCPLCRASSLLNHCSPDVIEHLSNAARSLLLAASSVLKADQHPDKPGFERITLVDETDLPERSD